MKVDLGKVYFEEKNNIGYVFINDPPANKMTIQFLIDFSKLVSEHLALSKVKGIIITGTGRHFSSGADVDQLKETYATQTKFDEDGNLIAYPIRYLEDRRSVNYFYNLNIPVISAISGMCVGSGFELALSSHIRICGNGSILGLPEASFGFLPGLGGTLRYVELIGLGNALKLVLSGETFMVEEAKEMGLVDGIVNKKEVLSYCEALMDFILQSETSYSKHNAWQYVERFNQQKKIT